MAEKNNRNNEQMNVLFEAILSLKTLDECYDFFEDLVQVTQSELTCLSACKQARTRANTGASMGSKRAP